MTEEEALKLAFKDLDEKALDIFIHKFGLLGEKKKSFLQIDKIFGYHRGKCNPIFNKAMLALRLSI